jgi:hypothetical protein
MENVSSLIDRKAKRVKQRLLKEVIWPLISPLYVDLQPDYRASIFLAGTERSGTTWISDVINYRRVFHPQPYLRPDNDDPRYLEVAERVLTGRIRHPWTDKFHRTVIARKRLIKDVRANLILKWLHTRFPEMPIVFVMRHPCAVVRSQLQRPHWRPDLRAEFLSQPELVEDYLAPFAEDIAKAETHFDILVFRWCIQNYVPLRQFQEGEIHIAFYEDFCIDPEEEVARMFAYLGKPYSPEVLEVVGKPSPVSLKDSAIVVGGSLIDSWRKQISPEQVERAVEILSLFGLDSIYSRESRPNPDGVKAFMSPSYVS